MNLEKEVHANLENAKENGYFDEGMELYGQPAFVIAEDMLS